MNLSARRIFLSEFMFWIVLAGFFIYMLLPLRQHLRLGMDLAGGTYLTLGVQTDKAVEAELIEKMQSLEKKLKQIHKISVVSKSVENEVINMTFGSAQSTQQAAQLAKTEFSDLSITTAHNTLKIELPSRLSQQIKKEAVTRDIEILRLRLDKVGVADIPVAAQGEKNIVIELPDVSDPMQAKAMIGKAARLEFRMVENIAATEEDLLDEYDGELPAGKEILPSKEAGRGGFYLVQRYADVTGKDLKEARAVIGGEAGVEPVVAFKFTADGGERFYELTNKNINRPLAIVLDGVVISAPMIKVAIKSEGVISGNFSIEDARELALLLKSGSFAAPVTFEEERQVGPQLGQESIMQGFRACAMALVLLFFFSIFYYSFSGLIAFVTLIYNLLIIMVGMAWMKATLTLPGIGGMILTIGMAIDASILIFEKIKEELSHGVPVNEAVKAGFDGAMEVILDANITTFLIGIVLYIFGTGPIQGFAVTMTIGIVATLITAILFQRSIFKFILQNFRIQKLKI